MLKVKTLHSSQLIKGHLKIYHKKKCEKNFKNTNKNINI